MAVRERDLIRAQLAQPGNICQPDRQGVETCSRGASCGSDQIRQARLAWPKRSRNLSAASSVRLRQNEARGLVAWKQACFYCRIPVAAWSPPGQSHR